jgi:amidophosphoribosyltransferase
MAEIRNAEMLRRHVNEKDARVQMGLTAEPIRREVSEVVGSSRASANSEPAETADELPGGPREACGVFGIYAPSAPVARLAYLGLYALQHRGQESAGIAVSDGRKLHVIKDMGLVTQVFDQARLAGLDGHIAIGHVRYSTAGSSTWENAQPIYRPVGDAGIALGHNGNLTNAVELAASLPPEAGPLESVESDSEIMASLLERFYPTNERSDGRNLETAFLAALPYLRGAFSVVAMDEAHLVGVRDPLGFRPLCLGRLGQGWVIASETCALDIVGAHFVREIEPGEMVVIDATGMRSHIYAQDRRAALCLFEFVYFARPDSMLFGKNVHAVRQRMGELLALQAPVDADLVMPVPESGIPAAQGYSRASGIPYGDGLVKNRYVGRTFIQPNQIMRDLGVRIKLNPLTENIAGKRLVVCDDSIVRGSTTRQIVSLLKQAGAKEVHLRISSPPYKWPCYFGMDTYNRSELIAASLSKSEIASYLGADSLEYIELDNLLKATGLRADSFCTACFTGNYPTPVPENLSKDSLKKAHSSKAGSGDPEIRFVAPSLEAASFRMAKQSSDEAALGEE